MENFTILLLNGDFVLLLEVQKGQVPGDFEALDGLLLPLRELVLGPGTGRRFFQAQSWKKGELAFFGIGNFLL